MTFLPSFPFQGEGKGELFMSFCLVSAWGYAGISVSWAVKKLKPARIKIQM